MTLVEILFSRKALTALLIAALTSLVLTFFPLVGTLGFEFSLAVAFITAFLSVFLSAEFINLDVSKRFVRERRFSDLVSSIFILNCILVALPFAIGLLSSVMRKDCYIKEGTSFYLLIPVVTVFFTGSLGILLGVIFPRRGFFVGALVLIATICFSLWKLYYSPSIFFYTPVIGFFPGPLYDEVIPITSSLVIYRIGTVCWGLLFIFLVKLIRGLKFGAVRWGSVISLFVLVSILALFHLKSEELGINYTREYITENFLKASLETEHFKIYYAPGTPAAKQIELIAGDHEWRYSQLEQFLKSGLGEEDTQKSNRRIADPADKIHSYIYPDIKTRKRLIGAGETTIANPIHREIHLVYDSFPHSVLKHELVHVMSSEFGMKVLRISPKVGLLEGLAVAADWGLTNGFTPHQWSASLLKTASAPDIKDILGMGFWYAPPKKSYALMGSFSRYLIEAYGIDRFKTLYRNGDFSVYGKSLDQLITDWKAFLQDIFIPPNAVTLAEYRFSEPSIFGATCPRKVAALKEEGMKAFNGGNLYEAQDYFLEALDFSGSEPALIVSLAYIYYYGGEYDQLIKIVEGAGAIPQVDKNILENLRGNVEWQRGNVARAHSIFTELLGKTLPEDIKREIEIKISSISIGGEIEEKMRLYFGMRDRLAQAVTLEEITKDSPDYAPAYYLLGRAVFNEGNYQMASPFLGQAEALGLPSISLDMENYRILGISLFAQADYEGAISRFGSIVEMNQDGALKEYAVDFIERCDWAKTR